MKNMRLRLVAFAAASLLSASAFAQAKGVPDPTYELKGDALMRALKGGGYTLLFRHMARDADITELGDKIVISDCSTQIPLSTLGRAQAQSVGNALRKLQIPIGETIASPFCRTMESARLIAGTARAENMVAGRKADDFNAENDFAPLVKVILTPPAAGTNRIIVGHNSAFTQIEGGPYQQEGEAAVFRAIDGRRVLIARLRVEDWQTYAFPTAGLPASARHAGSDPLLQHKGRALLTTLRFGGYTLFVAANPDRAKPGPAGTDCNASPALDEPRLEQARTLGTALAAVQFKLTEVFARGDCGAQEYARIVARRTEGIRTPGQNRAPQLAQILATPAPATSLRLIVGDSGEFGLVAGMPALAAGETAVLRTTEGGNWVVLARLTPQDWTDLPAAPR